MSSGKWQPLCLGLNVLKVAILFKLRCISFFVQTNVLTEFLNIMKSTKCTRHCLTQIIEVISFASTKSAELDTR